MSILFPHYDIYREASSTIFLVFGITRRVIEPRFPEPLVTTLTIMSSINALLTTHHCKIMIKGEVEQSREWCSALPYTTL